MCMNTENTNQLQLFKTNDYMKTKTVVIFEMWMSMMLYSMTAETIF